MEIISYEIIIVINTIFKNISINYLLFDSNTRRITLTSLSDPHDLTKRVIGITK